MPSLFYWKPRSDNTGHVAFRASSKLYLSFWPVDEFTFDLDHLDRTVPSTSATYEEDCACANIPDEQMDVVSSGVDVNSLKKWWQTYKISGFGALRNSCWAVKEAVVVGIEDRQEVKKLMKQLEQWQDEIARGLARNKVKRRVKKCAPDD